MKKTATERTWAWIPVAAFSAIGTPKAQPRTRPCYRGSRLGVYTPETAESWKDIVRIAALEFSGLEISGPIRLEAVFILPRPKTKKAERFVATKPDIDNLTKPVMDALSSIRLWRDDRQVGAMVVEKVYQKAGEAPGLVVTIHEWREE
jgi:Holliday junction resolvase RusA-like endonuclease